MSGVRSPHMTSRGSGAYEQHDPLARASIDSGPSELNDDDVQVWMRVWVRFRVRIAEAPQQMSPPQYYGMASSRIAVASQATTRLLAPVAQRSPEYR